MGERREEERREGVWQGGSIDRSERNVVQAYVCDVCAWLEIPKRDGSKTYSATKNRGRNLSDIIARKET